MSSQTQESCGALDGQCGHFLNGFCVHAQTFLQQQRLQSLGLMVGEIAHDLNNVFSMLLGHTELLEHELRNTYSPIPERLKTILDALNSGSDLCRSMLAFAGKRSASITLIDPIRLVDELQGLFRVVVSPAASFTCNLQRPVPMLKADPGQIRQIVMNLLMNASEALRGENGCIQIDVYAHTLDAPAGAVEILPVQYVCMKVKDNGCGMDEETLAKLFNPFFTTKLTGKGLGLTAVSHLVNSLHGSLTVESAPDKGSTFTVLLPASDEQEPATIPPPPPPSGIHLSLSGTVLFVDDEEQLRMIGSDILRQTGATVITAANGHDAIECYRAHPEAINLVLLDAMMPDMNGCDVFKAIHRMNPQANVVLISGYTESDLEKRLDGIKPSDILLKPVPASLLKQTVARFLPHKKEA
jgi:CheY-like chemotaxis protein